jgi:hypothetical protein
LSAVQDFDEEVKRAVYESDYDIAKPAACGIAAPVKAQIRTCRSPVVLRIRD